MQQPSLYTCRDLLKALQGCCPGICFNFCEELALGSLGCVVAVQELPSHTRGI